MPFRARFDCLWCGDAWTTRSPDDLEGWAQLCPTCLGKAGSNAFLRARLRQALSARGAAGAAGPVAAPAGDRPGVRPAGRRSPPAPAFPDDWFLRRGVYERGPVHDAAWQAELDVVTRWLDQQPLAGRIDEPGAGVGFFSPLLAEKGELRASDPDGDALDLARDRLVAHRLRAHLHVADPWPPPTAHAPSGAPAEAPADAAPADAAPADVPEEGLADAVVAAFLVGRVRGAGLDTAAASLRGRLRSGGRLALIDLRPDAAGGPPDGIAWTWHEPAVLEAAIERAGFVAVEVASTGRFFVLLSAVAG